ncbi:MAG: hypothetical protein AAF356_04000 [Planctomycetota bacterium]
MRPPPPTTTAPAPEPDRRASGRRTPLWAVLAVTFLGSIGTGAVANGVFFLAESAYGFDKAQNFQLGVWMGITYIAGALAIGPLLRAAARRFDWLSTRAALGALLVLVGLVCQIPPAAGWLLAGEHAWTLWLSVGVFGPATGAFWPICESYLSGARRGERLRSAVGRFNITWASAVVLSYWLMAPVVEGSPLLVLALLGLVHVVAAVVLLWFPAEPAAHAPEDDKASESNPASYRRLLTVFRVLLPLSYVLLAALNPFLVAATAALQIEPGWKMLLASMWMLPRVVLFFAFERWHGWHGRWWMPIAAGALFVAGFALAVLAPGLQDVAGRTGGIALLVVGLVAYGTGMSMAYVGALYYVLEVGEAQVDAGGSHEALIGVGYTLGPACGLLAVLTADRLGVSFETLLLVGIGASCLGVAAIAGLLSIRRRAR